MRLVAAALSLLLAAGPAWPMALKGNGGAPGANGPAPGGPKKIPGVPAPIRGPAANIPGKLPQGLPSLPRQATPSAGGAAQGKSKAEPLNQLKGLAGPSDSKDNGGVEKAGMEAGELMDGEKVGETPVVVPMEDAASPDRELSELVEKIEEIRYTRKSLKALRSGELSGTMRLLSTGGKRWHWEGKFKKGTLLRVVSGGGTLVLTRVTSAATKKVKDLTLADLRGILPEKTIRAATKIGKDKRPRVNLEKLKEAVIADLAAFNRGIAITPLSEVRVLHFIPFKEARAKLPENRIFEPLEATLPPRERVPVSIPESLQPLHRYLPKVVFLDLRLYKDRVPFDHLEDMGKLMKAGVYFVVMSDKPREGPGSVEEMLTAHLTPRERDQFARHKIITLSDDGNALADYHGPYPHPLPVKRFLDTQLDLMRFLAQAEGGKVTALRGTEFTVELSKSQDAQAFAERFSGLLLSYGRIKRDYSVKITALKDGRTALTLRPSTLESAIPDLLAVMRDRLGLFVNPSDTFVISRPDSGIAKAITKAHRDFFKRKLLKEAASGPLEASAHAPDLQGQDLAEMSLAALLGPYRQNLPGDFAVSASKLEGFRKHREGGGGDHYSINMLMGHVMHSAFNWAVWLKRNTGVFPGREELIARADRNWEQEEAQSIRNLITNKGETKTGYRKAVRARLFEMHATMIEEVLKHFPINLGTELPNLHIINRYNKQGELEHRDIVRLIYDCVLARVVNGVIYYLVVDFKTGQTYVLQALKKNTQYQLYDVIPPLMWDKLHIPYGLTGKPFKTGGHSVGFLFPPGLYQPTLNRWSRDKFENKFIKNLVNRMRKANLPPAARKDADTKSAKPGKVVAVKTASFDTLKLPRFVPGLKIQYQWAQKIIKGKKKIEYRGYPPPVGNQAFFAIVQTFTEEEPGRPAEVVGFARIEKVTRRANGQYEWHLSHVTPVKPYVATNNRPGSITWMRGTPVKGPKALRP